ncbi:3-oxoacyl-[acyl-carrier-protein] reductase OS=Castellaniella defragrans OX=75697 GN=HNR28_002208 PE=3 SV=1 [Castellaniella defragrans]
MRVAERGKAGLADRVALVTGGASGIGLAAVERFVHDGARVIVWDIDAVKLRACDERLGAAVLCQKVDVTDEGQVGKALGEAVKRFSRLDIVVNSAGIVGPGARFWEHSLFDWSRVLNLNLTATFIVAKASVPYLLRNGYGRIVNVASIAGKEGNPNQAAYSASKAGVIGLTKTMGKDLAGTNILVNAIAPAAVQSALLAQMSAEQLALVRAKIPMARLGRVDEVAAMIRWLASEECSFSTGAVFDISGGRATY